MDIVVPAAACLSIMVTMRYAARSHPGLVRDHNEDAHTASARLLAVADGVGGEAAGEIASGLAVEVFEALGTGKLPPDPTAELPRAVSEANNRIGESADEHPENRGMATTLTALYLTDAELLLVHAGDSRAYRLRDGELTQLSRDDSYIQALIDEGALSAEEAQDHPYRSVVMKVLQGYPLEPSCESFDVRLGDRYLVCSDGLSDVVDSDGIAAALEMTDVDLDGVTEALVDKALEAGGPDNITVAVGEVIETPTLRRKMSTALGSLSF